VRRLAWVGVALCVVVFGLGGAKGLFWPPGVTAANFNRIRVGRTEIEVDGSFGSQASACGLLTDEANPDARSRRIGFIGIWAGKAGAAYIRFGLDGRVTRADRFEPTTAGAGGR